jgi:aryl-alcohol dehydrogenase-like predicted oxidoreductase
MLPARSLGTTGLLVSRLGLGMAALGRPGYINLGHAHDLGGYAVEEMAAHAAATLDVAWEGGVRYFDAARSYGRGEEFLARWLAARAIDSASVVVGSKWGYTYTANWQVSAEKHEVKDHSRATFVRQLEESIDLLGPFLRVYMIHSATPDSGALDQDDLLDALADARSGGRLHALGLSISGPASAETLRRAREVRRDGVRLFDVVQATWNPLEPSLGPLLAECRAEGMGILVKEALANGRLTGRNIDVTFSLKHEQLDTEAARLGCTIDQLALACALNQPWADCVLSGAATPEQLRSNLGALDVRFDRQAADVLAALVEPVEDYWNTRARLPWN